MKLATYKRLTYPQNIWSTVLEREVLESELPPDWEATLSYLFKTLPSLESAALEYFFRHRFTDREISDTLDVANETTRKLIYRGICRLRNPYRLRILVVGYKELKTIRSTETNENLMSASIFTLDAPHSALQALHESGIHTLGDLISQKKRHLLKIPSIGESAVKKISNSLTVIGLSFSNEPPPAPISPISPDQSIWDLHLGTRAANALLRASICTVGDLTAITHSDLRSIRCIGPGTLDNICLQLARFGLSLAPEP